VGKWLIPLIFEKRNQSEGIEDLVEALANISIRRDCQHQILEASNFQRLLQIARENAVEPVFLSHSMAQVVATFEFQSLSTFTSLIHKFDS
jgi:hypothetical protein